MEEESFEIGETLEFNALVDLERTREFHDAVDLCNAAKELRSSRQLQWLDETGGQLAQVIVFDNEEYYDA